MSIPKDARIYVAGHRGLVGNAIMNALHEQGYVHLITRTKKELDLTKQEDVLCFFEAEKPEYVILAAAKVGGIFVMYLSEICRATDQRNFSPHRNS